VNLRLKSILKCTPEMWQNFCRYSEELISEDSTKLVSPLIISLGESDRDFDAGDDD
jgi:hypothetical protein